MTMTLDEALAAVPYAAFLGVEAAGEGGDADTVMRFSQRLVGNPLLPALHRHRPLCPDRDQGLL